MNDEHIDFSLIIACYNEESHLERNIKEIVKILDLIKINYEIICVDDCSKDKTKDIIKYLMSEYSHVRLLNHNINEGRGKTVSDGIRIAKGDIMGFIDIDLSTSPWYLPMLYSAIKEDGYDIATALRLYKFNWKGLHRWIISRGYRVLLRLALPVRFKDTETGCKIFRREKILPILDEIKDNHWFWDTEIMVRSYLKNLKIVEIPTLFERNNFLTTARLCRDSWRHFINLIKLRRELMGKFRNNKYESSSN